MVPFLLLFTLKEVWLHKPVHMIAPLGTHAPCVCVLNFSYKDTQQIELAPPQWPHFKLYHLQI